MSFNGRAERRGRDGRCLSATLVNSMPTAILLQLLNLFSLTQGTRGVGRKEVLRPCAKGAVHRKTCPHTHRCKQKRVQPFLSCPWGVVLAMTHRAQPATSHLPRSGFACLASPTRLPFLALNMPCSFTNNDLSAYAKVADALAKTCKFNLIYGRTC